MTVCIAGNISEYFITPVYVSLFFFCLKCTNMKELRQHIYNQRGDAINLPTFQFSSVLPSFGDSVMPNLY